MKPAPLTLTGYWEGSNADMSPVDMSLTQKDSAVTGTAIVGADTFNVNGVVNDTTFTLGLQYLGGSVGPMLLVLSPEYFGAFRGATEVVGGLYIVPNDPIAVTMTKTRR